MEEKIRSSKSSKGKQIMEKGRTRYYDKKQQLDMILAAQGLLDVDRHDASDVQFGGDEDCTDGSSKVDIWDDAVCMRWLKEGFLAKEVDPQEGKRVRKRAKQYCWRDDKLYFKGLYVPKPEERLKLVNQMHEDLGHFGE